jgi:exopolyphosphatase/guanosine-5'-triphosphate,3'-diphosphate pyrophosphatase
MILAGVDIGTLTCRLLIAKVADDGSLAELYSERRILCLGEGLDAHHVLHLAAMARVLKTLQEWRRVIETYRVDREVAVATSAVREAANQQEFLTLVKRDTGFEVEVISGKEEARRTMLGIRSGLPSGTGDILGLDIGGGSTEFILERRGRPPVVRSLDLGVVRLTERFFRHDPPTPAERQAARDLVQAQTSAMQTILVDLSHTTFVGTAGTITTLAAMAQKLPIYEPARIHNYLLRLDTIRQIEAELFARTKAQRQGLPGLEFGREDVILAGALILCTVMEVLSVEECLVSDFGLREGLLIDLVRRQR